MKRCVVLNCMDGSVQGPVLSHFTHRHDPVLVDVVTEPGPARALLTGTQALREHLLERLALSVRMHRATAIAVVAHPNCMGDPDGERDQRRRLHEAVRFLSARFAHIPVEGLWVDAAGGVSPIPAEVEATAEVSIWGDMGAELFQG